MGWDGCNEWTTKKDVVEDLRRQYSRDGFTLLGDAPFNGGQFFAVRRVYEKEGNEEVVEFVVTALTKKYDGEWSTKTMSEDMGPVEVGCPLKLLKLTKGLDSDYAREWRKKVEAYHVKKATDKKKTFNKGDLVRCGSTEYTIVGPYARSYAIRNAAGKIYKATARNLVLVKAAE